MMGHSILLLRRPIGDQIVACDWLVTRGAGIEAERAPAYYLSWKVRTSPWAQRIHDELQVFRGLIDERTVRAPRRVSRQTRCLSRFPELFRDRREVTCFAAI